MHPVVEKLIFAAIPIMFSCIVYLITDLNALKAKIALVESNASLARSDINLNRNEQLSAAALARAELDKRISILELKIERIGRP